MVGDLLSYQEEKLLLESGNAVAAKTSPAAPLGE